MYKTVLRIFAIYLTCVRYIDQRRLIWNRPLLHLVEAELPRVSSTLFCFSVSVQNVYMEGDRVEAWIGEKDREDLPSFL